TGTSQFDLTLEVTETLDGLRAVFQYGTDLFDADTIDRMTGHFIRLLEGIVATPEQSIARLPLPSEAEWRDLVVARNATDVDISAVPFVHHAFEAHVARDPAALALTAGDVRLSYGDLNARANQLAHHLHQLSIGPDDIVGVCL